MASVYSAVVWATALVALWESFRLVSDRRRGGRVFVWLQTALPWITGWVILQMIAPATLLALRNGPRAGGLISYYVLFTLFVPFLLVAGSASSTRIGLPALEPMRHRHRRGSRWPRLLGEFALLAGIPLLITFVLLQSVEWKPSESLEQQADFQRHTTLSNTLFLGWLLVSAALLEEILFRHYLLAWLAERFGGRRTWQLAVAVAATAGLWSLGHGAMLEPAWLKYTQIGLYGVALGVIRIRHGLAAAVGLHLVFNAAALAMAREN